VKKLSSGFTLIELLIVVAIIAILAAIAVPNFLEAQTRAKNARIVSDMRALATAVETYTIDNNAPAPEAGKGGYPGVPILFGKSDGGPWTGILNEAITTPIAYMSTFELEDPYFKGQDVNSDERTFTYQAYTWRWPKGKPLRLDSERIQFNENTLTDINGRQMTGTTFKDIFGVWRMWSVGPDKQWDNKAGGKTVTNTSPVSRPYDATNGTISIGNIVRSQKGSGDQSWFKTPNV
jgi:prepilin-type N-terminal cleavage/methylation domain-containing protein